MRFTFVILHYLAADLTTECIDVIRGNFPSADIVVVDNGSPDGSGKTLEEKYAGQTGIHFILLQRNSGFARGNNAGYLYAVEKLSPDFIAVINNDLYIRDKSFIEKVVSEYELKPFAVLGPDIINKGGEHQNPHRTRPLTLKEAKNLKRKMNIKRKMYSSSYSASVTDFISRKIHPSHHHKDGSVEPNFENCVLHGSCLVFSKDFISSRTLAFNPATFLYAEEDILQFECSRDGLSMRYCPSVEVFHAEDGATDRAFRNERQKTKMKYTHLVKSLSAFISIIKRSKTKK